MSIERVSGCHVSTNHSLLPALELYSIGSVFGLPPSVLVRATVDQKKRSTAWASVAGVVEGHELLLAIENGGLVVAAIKMSISVE